MTTDSTGTGERRRAARAGQLLRGWTDHATVRFLAMSLLGYGIDLTLLLALSAWGAFPRAVNVTIAFWVTYCCNFFLHRAVTFRAQDARPLREQLLRYAPQVTVDYALTLGGVELFAGVLGLDLFTARLLAAGLNLTFNYVAFRWWTFIRRSAR